MANAPGTGGPTDASQEAMALQAQQDIPTPPAVGGQAPGATGAQATVPVTIAGSTSNVNVEPGANFLADWINQEVMTADSQWAGLQLTEDDAVVYNGHLYPSMAAANAQYTQDLSDWVKGGGGVSDLTSQLANGAAGKPGTPQPPDINAIATEVMNKMGISPDDQVLYMNQIMGSGGNGGAGYGNMQLSAQAKNVATQIRAAANNAGVNLGYKLNSDFSWSAIGGGAGATGSAPAAGGTGSTGATGAPAAPTKDPSLIQYVQQWFSTASSTQIAQLQRQMAAAGMNVSGMNGQIDRNTVDNFANLLQTTQMNIDKGDPAATWQSTLNDAIKKNGFKLNADGSYTGSKSDTMNLTPILAQTAFTQAVGRAPSADELKNFMGAFNAITAANPIVSTTTIGAKGDVQTATPSLSEKADTVQAAELQAAQQNPQFAAYQSATTYWGALQQALQAPTSVENNLR